MSSQSSSTHGQRQPILFLTSSEWGQANVILATIHEFLLRDEYEIHLASHAKLRSRVDELFQGLSSSYPRPCTVVSGEDRYKLTQQSGDDDDDNGNANNSPPSITFHTIPGLSVAEMCARDGVAHTLAHPPGVNGAINAYRHFEDIGFRVAPEDYVESVHASLKILNQVKPVLIVSEPGACEALDACGKLDLPFLILAPNSFRDFEKFSEPWYRMIWKYPMSGTGFPFPLPLHLILANVYVALRATLLLIRLARDPSSRFYKLNAARHAAGFDGLPAAFTASRLARRIILPSLPQLDWPRLRVRDTTIGVGPIVVPARAVRDVDPALDAWLLKKSTETRTVLVNLGTHYSMDLRVAAEVARAVKALLGEFADLQVLWKVKFQGSGSVEKEQRAELEAVLGKELVDKDRVRLVTWLKPEPVAVLETGRVVAQVHHGGANSFFECCRSGVPQVICAAWHDTYEYAARAEYFGIGVFANKKAAPFAETQELLAALRKTVTSAEMQEKALEVQMLCKRRGEGRVVAHDLLVDYLHKDGEKA